MEIVAAADRSGSITQDCLRAAKKARGQYVERTMLCFMSKAIIKVVFTGLTILVVSSRIKISDPRMNNQETWHLVDECVLSPLHGSVEVTPEDSVSNASQVNSGHSGTSSSSSSSSKRRREAKIKAAISSLQAKQLAERVNRDNQVRELEL